MTQWIIRGEMTFEIEVEADTPDDATLHLTKKIDDAIGMAVFYAPYRHNSVTDIHDTNVVIDEVENLDE